MYEIEFPVITSSAGWSQVIQLIDDSTNQPYEGLGDYRFKMQVKDVDGNVLLTADTLDGSATINSTVGEISWSFTKAQLPNSDTPQTFNIGAVLITDVIEEQLFIGTISFVDGYVT